MPFGLRNAAQTFQRLIDEILKGLPFAFAYIDDVLIVSRDIKEHQDHLLQVFERLTHFGLKINLSRCDFAVSKLNFLGHMIDEQGIIPVPEKVTAIQNYIQKKNPTNFLSSTRHAVATIIKQDINLM